MSRSRRSRSLQPPSDHGGVEDSMQSSDSSSNLTFHRPRDDRLVKLNVGGRIFDTTEATLLSRGQNNFLASLVSSQLPSIRDDQGRFFIDRSGSIFEILLEFLRTGLLHVPEHIPTSVRLQNLFTRFYTPHTNIDPVLFRITSNHHLNTLIYSRITSTIPLCNLQLACQRRCSMRPTIMASFCPTRRLMPVRHVSIASKSNHSQVHHCNTSPKSAHKPTY
jgi:hypothetical protein